MRRHPAPSQVAFVPAAKTGAEPLFIVNRLIDVIFTADLLLSFRLMYSEVRHHRVATTLEPPCNRIVTTS